MDNAALAAGASVTFQLNNNLLSVQDLIALTMEWNLNTSYRIEQAAVGMGTTLIRVTNIGVVSLSKHCELNLQ